MASIHLKSHCATALLHQNDSALAKLYGFGCSIPDASQTLLRSQKGGGFALAVSWSGTLYTGGGTYIRSFSLAQRLCSNLEPFFLVCCFAWSTVPVRSRSERHVVFRCHDPGSG